MQQVLQGQTWESCGAILTFLCKPDAHVTVTLFHTKDFIHNPTTILFKHVTVKSAIKCNNECSK